MLRFSFSLAPRWLILLHFLLGIFKHWSYPVLPAVAAWGIYLEPYSPNSLLPHLSRSLNPSSGFPGCLSQLFTHMLPLPPPHCLNPLNHKSSDVTVFSYSPQSIFSLFLFNKSGFWYLRCLFPIPSDLNSKELSPYVAEQNYLAAVLVDLWPVPTKHWFFHPSAPFELRLPVGVW